jgi:hypothetical protein
MTARLVLVIGIWVLGACTPQPRCPTYFEGHAAEATRIVSACAAGTVRGQECENAQAGLSAAARDARMTMLRKSFQ